MFPMQSSMAIRPNTYIFLALAQHADGTQHLTTNLFEHAFQCITPPLAFYDGNLRMKSMTLFVVYQWRTLEMLVPDDLT